MAAQPKPCCNKWSASLAVLFMIAMIMGPGPGMLLVNPAEGEANPATLMGMPIMYAWALIWFAVQSVIIVTAYFTVWSKDGD